MACNIECYLFQLAGIWMYHKQTTRSNYIDLISGVSSYCNFGAECKLFTIRILKNQLYTLSGIMLVSAQVSILALKYFIFLFRGFSLYVKFVTRCCGAANLISAWVNLICICKQNESSLEKSSDWPHKESCMQAGPIFSWCALGGLYSKDLFLS